MNLNQQSNSLVTSSTLNQYIKDRNLDTLPPQKRYMGLLDLKRDADLAYQIGEPIMTDDAYHALVDTINIDADAVNVPRVDEHGVVVHSNTLKPIHSLNKVYDTKEVCTFLSKFNDEDEVYIEPKLDGVTMVICYRNHKFSHIRLKTKVIYYDNAKYLPIANIQHILNHPTHLENVDIRGEVVITKSNFAKFNTDFVNERTIVASMLNTRDTEVLNYNSDLFDFVVFETTPSMVLSFVFTHVPRCFFNVAHVKQLLEDGHIETVNDTYDCPYLLDGLVFKLPKYENLGYTKKYPRFQIALKWLTEPVYTTITAINITNVPDSEKIAVTVNIIPITINGVNINRVNVGSEATIAKRNLFVNKIIQVRLAGGVIPVIV